MYCSSWKQVVTLSIAAPLLAFCAVTPEPVKGFMRRLHCAELVAWEAVKNLQAVSCLQAVAQTARAVVAPTV